MSISLASVRRAHVDASDWGSCVTSDGRTIGTAQWLRRRPDGWSHTVLLWRCEPTSFEYVFPGDESFIVLSGCVRIDLEDGESTELRAGDVASFPEKTRSVWTISEPIVKFTVHSVG